MPRAFLLTLVGVNAILALAGAVYAGREHIPAAAAAPIVAAFLLQISFYLAPGFPEVRKWLEGTLSPVQIATLALAAALVPYLVYSLPTGVFQLRGLLKLAAIAAVPAFVFVVRPTASPGLTWQDLAALAAVAVAELGKVFRQIYLSPIADLRLESLGRIMIIGVGATAFLSLRRLEGSGYQWRISKADCKTGLKQFALFLPLGITAGIAIRFAAYQPARVDPWMYLPMALGTFLGAYAAVALFEEFFFRGVLQNLAGASLGHPAGAQAGVSILFGLTHLPFRVFPNWRFAVLAAIVGWFYGQAYRERRSVVASSIAHALVVTTWRLLFAG